MIAFIPYQPHHMGALQLQLAQAALQPLVDNPRYAAALAGEHSWTALDDGRILAVAGVLPQWPGRSIAWALLGRSIGPRQFPALHRKVLAVLEAAASAGARRIETAVCADFENGHRWAEKLGFRAEGLMRAYCSEGRDHVLYARVSPAFLPRATQVARNPHVSGVGGAATSMGAMQ